MLMAVSLTGYMYAVAYGDERITMAQAPVEVGYLVVPAHMRALRVVMSLITSLTMVRWRRRARRAEDGHHGIWFLTGRAKNQAGLI